MGNWSRATALGAFPPKFEEKEQEVLELRSRIFAFVLDEDGQALVEYSLIILLVALVTITALTSIGTALNGIFTTVAGAL